MIPDAIEAHHDRRAILRAHCLRAIIAAVHVTPPDRLQSGDVVLVPEERLLLKNGRPVPLTPKAFDVLVALATNPGRLLTKDQLLQAGWGDTVVEEANLSYHVFAIRKALATPTTAGSSKRFRSAAIGSPPTSSR